MLLYINEYFYNDIDVMQPHSIIKEIAYNTNINVKDIRKWGYLTESDGVVTIFDDVFDEFWNIVKSYYNFNLFNGEVKQIETKYAIKNVYNKQTHQKDVQFDFCKNHMNSTQTDIEDDWHQIVFCVGDNRSILLKHNASMAVYRHSKYKNQDISHNNDQLFILLNREKVQSKKEFNKFLRHELTHIMEMSTLPLINYNTEDINGNKNIGRDVNGRNKLGLVQIQYDNEKLMDISEKIRQYAYVFSTYEQNSFLGETHQVIIDFDDEIISTIQKECKTQDDIIRCLINFSLPSNRFEKINEAINIVYWNYLQNIDQITSILLFALYLKMFGNCKDFDNDEYIDEYFIRNYYIGETTIDINIVKNVKERLKKTINYRYNKYKQCLKIRVYKSYMMRIGKY